MPSALKTIDENGRITVGRAFAGRLVEVVAGDDAIILRFRHAVPEREAWLWENTAAKVSVDWGLKEAHDRHLDDGPDLDAALALADGLGDQE